MENTQARPRGAIPALKAAFVGMASRQFADKLAIYLVVVAGALTILKKAGFDWHYSALYIVSLSFAAMLYEMSASRAMIRAWYEARPLSMACNAILYICAFGFGIFQWVGTAAENESEKANVQKAAFITSSSVQSDLSAARDALKEARAKAEEKHSAAWEAIPVVNGQKIESHAQAEALVATFTSNTRFMDLTDNCSKTTGKQTRQFCQDYHAAQAALAWADTHPELVKAADQADADVKRLEAEFKVASSKAIATPIETNQDTSDLFVLTDWFGMTPIAAQRTKGVMGIAVISILLGLTSMRDEFDELSKTARRRWSLFSKPLRWVYRLATGHDYVSHTHNHVTQWLDPRGGEALQEVGSIRKSARDFAAQFEAIEAANARRLAVN